MPHGKMIAVPFLLSELLPFDYFFIISLCMPYSVTIWNIFMEFYSNVYEVKMLSHRKKCSPFLSLLSYFLPLIKFLADLVRTISK